jgi:electron transport complex protein RnfG
MLLDDTISIDDNIFLKLKKTKNIHVARKNGKVTALIFPTRAPDGYSGSVESIIGINIDGTIAGVRIIQHRETPGLGDKVELKKSPWVLGFNGRSLDNPSPSLWKVKKDKGEFDQFTGATITPRAVLKSIYNTLVFFRKHKDSLIEQANNLEGKAQTQTAEKTGDK